MDNENNTNRDDSVSVSPNLGAIGGLGGENGAPLVEGLALGGQGGGNGAPPVAGLGTFGAATDETLQAPEGGIVISSTKVQQFVEEFRDLISIAGDDVLSNIEPLLLSITTEKDACGGRWSQLG